MYLHKLIKLERPIYFNYRLSAPIDYIKSMLQLAREQGKLPEICSRLGISRRSMQRWLPTPDVKIYGKKRTVPLNPQALFGDEEITVFDVQIRRRKGRKRKALKVSKGMEYLLQQVFLFKEPIPDVEPTNEEIMALLIRFKESVGTWKRVSEKLQTDEMVLYRFRKTGKMKKCNRILFHMVLAGSEASQEQDN